MFFNANRTGEKSVPPMMLTTPALPGIFAGTKIATRQSWTPIEQLSVGDVVMTAEHGEQVIASVRTSEFDVASAKPVRNLWPIQLPKGILGNSSAMVLAPETNLVLQDKAAEVLFGQTCVSVKAKNLIGYRGISRARLAQPTAQYTLEFAQGVSLVAEGGVYLDLPFPNENRRFMALDGRQTRLMVRHMTEEDNTMRSHKVASGWI